jgi:hypothetical protein
VTRPPRIAALLLLLATSACGPKKKIEECKAFVTAVNDGVDRVHKAMGATPEAGQSVAELRALATEMDAIGKQAEAVPLSTPELQKLSQRYLELTKDIAMAARELADAVDAVDVEKSTKLQARMDDVVKKEDPLIEELNRFCLTP